jgi:hypothetical protein
MGCDADVLLTGSQFCVTGETFTVGTSWDSFGADDVYGSTVILAEGESFPGQHFFSPGDALTVGPCGALTHRAILCNSSGRFDFRVEGENLTDFEGKTVWASAVQPRGDVHNVSVTVLLQTFIASGAFTVSCPTCLEENFYYPSYAVFVDSDESGDCTPHDHVFVGQLYGWMENVSATFNFPSAFQEVGERTTWGSATLCNYYIPASLLI